MVPQLCNWEVAPLVLLNEITNKVLKHPYLHFWKSFRSFNNFTNLEAASKVKKKVQSQETVEI